MTTVQKPAKHRYNVHGNAQLLVDGRIRIMLAEYALYVVCLRCWSAHSDDAVLFLASDPPRWEAFPTSSSAQIVSLIDYTAEPSTFYCPQFFQIAWIERNSCEFNKQREIFTSGWQCARIQHLWNLDIAKIYLQWWIHENLGMRVTHGLWSFRV